MIRQQLQQDQHLTILWALSKASLEVKPTTHCLALLGTAQAKPAAWVGSGKGASCSLPDLAPHMNALRAPTTPLCTQAKHIHKLLEMDGENG